MNNKNIGIVIPVVGLWEEYTLPCIESLKSDKYSLKILIIDNKSEDNNHTFREASKMVQGTRINMKKRVWLRRFEERIPLAACWNYGIRRHFGNGIDYCFVINNDILMSPDTIDNMMERMLREEKEKGKIGFMVTGHNIQGELPNPQDILIYDSNLKKDVPEAECPDFSNFVINREIFREVGEFDEGFRPAYHEDRDFHFRIKLAGISAINYPPASYYHFGSRTQVQNGGMVKNIAFEKNKKYIEKKWGEIDNSSNGTYKNPFNDPKKSIRWTLQDACKEDCQCNVKCQEIIDWRNN